MPLLSPPQVLTEDLLISPEALVAASLPWQGMGSPWKTPRAWAHRQSKYKRSTSPVHNPWDVGVDEFISSGGTHSSGSAILGRPPPVIDAETRTSVQPGLEQQGYKIVSLQPMPISGPALVAHGYKPSGSYANPLTPGAAGRGAAFIQLHTRLRARAQEDPVKPWLTSVPSVHPLDPYIKSGQLGSTEPGNSEPGPDLMMPPKYQPSTMASRHFMAAKRLMWDSFDAQAMSKVAPTVGATSWMVRPVFDFRSAKTDKLNKLLFKAQTQRSSPPPAYEQVPMWPGQPPRPLFD